MARGKKKESLTLEEKLKSALVPEDEQPYEVPENWCWVRLKAISDLYNGDRGKNYPSKKDYVARGIPFINAGTISNNSVNLELANYITEEKYNTLSAGKIKQNDILYCLRGSLGKCAIITESYKGAISSSLCILRTKQDIMDRRALLYLLNSDVISSQQIEVDNGSAQPNLSAKSVSEYRIPLPPLAEQHRIVKRIDSLFSQLDDARDKAQEALDSFEFRRDSLLHKAFVGELTKKWRGNNHIELKAWKYKSLRDCSSIIGDGLHGTPQFSESEDYYFVNGNNFDGRKLLIKADTKRVSKTEYDKYYISLYKDKTVFVSINGTLGKTAFYNDEPIILGKSACYVNISDNLNKYYLRYYFESKEFRDYANGKATGSTIKNLGLKAMREMVIPVPCIEEQEEIVRLLDNTLSEEDRLMEVLETIIDNIELIKKSILAKAFRGELGTNAPEDENAIELLKSIIDDKKES